MGRTFIRQDAQIRESVTYDDTKTVGSTMETAQTNIEDDLNCARSQIKRAIWADSVGNWFDDIPTHNAKKRGINQLAEHLDELEEQPFLFRTQVLAEITVPSAASAISTLTFGAIPGNTETVVIGSKTYTFQTVLTDVDGNVLIGGSASDSLDNLIAAINLGAGAGTVYALSTTANTDVSAAAGAGDTMDVTALAAGSAANLVATTTTVGSASWTGATLAGGAGDVVVLSVASSEAPSETAAVGSVATEGAMVAYNAGFAEFSLAEVAGQGPIRPNNLCLVVDADTGQPIQSEITETNLRDVYALIQSEIVTDGHTFNDVDQRVMLSFVRVNAEGIDLEACPAADIAGKIINYAYVRQMHLDNIPKWAFLTGAFVDETALGEVTLNRAIDNQSGIATQTQNIDWDVADTFELAFTADAGGTNMLILSPTAGGNTMQINIDTLDINNTSDADFLNGVKLDSGGTEIDIGVTAGTIETTSTNDLKVKGAGELYLDDGNQTGSSWAQTDGIKLSDTTAEWDAFETEFGGEVSLLRAIVLASKKENRTKTTAAVTGNITANTNVTGAAGSPNLDAQLADYSYVGSFVDDVDVFLNGELLRGGVDAAANHDVYPGDTPADGDLKFEFALHYDAVKPDQITMIVYGESTT